jgi:hypothetical protein
MMPSGGSESVIGHGRGDNDPHDFCKRDFPKTEAVAEKIFANEAKFGTGPVAATASPTKPSTRPTKKRITSARSATSA